MPLFERISKITSTAIQAAANGAQASSRNGSPSYMDRLAQSEGEVREKIDRLCMELGKAYFDLHADDHQTEMEDRLAAIRDAYAEIDQYRQQADEVTARQRCPACGARLPESSMFCNACGTKLPEAPGTQADQDEHQDQALCPKCGAALGPDDVFCASCGADLRE